MHRDLKGENLLITDNNRIKVCDFGFARIAARNEDEMRRISYCGTDGYMSPEILMGVDFSLPSDVFSLGVIFCEIISRHLVDPNTFKRQMPSFGLDEDEVREMASDGCPVDFINLCIYMTKVEPSERPDMRHVIQRLRGIEQEVVQREYSKGTLTNVGSLRGSNLAALTGNKAKGKRPGARRLPSFEGQVSASKISQTRPKSIKEESHERSSSESSDEDVEEALRALEQMTIGQKHDSRVVADTIRAAGTYKAAGHGNPWWDDDSNSTLPDLPASWLQRLPEDSNSSTWKRIDHDKEDSSATVTNSSMANGEDEYSTSVVRPSRQVVHPSLASSLSKMTGSVMRNVDSTESTMTVRNRPPLVTSTASGAPSRATHREASEAETLKPSVVTDHPRDASGGEDENTTQSYMTARSEHHGHAHHHGGDPSLAMATIASSIYEPTMMYHRFTLVKNGTRRPGDDPTGTIVTPSKMPYQLILANALTKCNVCSKRLGFGAYMDCDDCPYKTHVGCAAMAEPNCQELQIPGSASPTGSPDLSSSTSTNSPGRAGSDEEAVREQNGEAIARVPSPPIRINSAKSPPSSLSKGVALFRKRNSKSPPPKSNNPPSVVRV